MPRPQASLERSLLQGVVAVLALIPISAGLAGMVLGPGMAGPAAADISVDSHFRYLSGLLLALGLAFWSTIPDIAHRTARFRLLTAVVFVGGLGRLLGVVLHGLPSAPMTGGLAMELVVTPLLCLWQSRVHVRSAAEPRDGIT